MSKFFFVGIGGIGMSALAELFSDQGHSVAGSDVAKSDSVERLLQKGISVHLGHDLAHFFEFQPDIVVVNSAISSQNPIVLEAQKMGCNVVKRGELLATCVNSQEGLVVSGSHGKTTTSSMLAHILKVHGIDASFAIGGRFADTKANSHLGTAPFFVAEGDESDASFLSLKPKILAITNLDADHMSTYGHSFEVLVDHFAGWVLGLRPKGAGVFNSDDPGVLAVLQKIEEKAPQFWETRRLVMVGKSLPKESEPHISEFIQLRAVFQRGPRLEVQGFFSSQDYSCTLPIIGEFNARNALMAVAMAQSMGVEGALGLETLKSYPGILRRMQYLGDFRSVPVYEDYGHHPTEIQASVAGLRKAYPDRRLIHVFQLHRYTRTRDLWNDFIDVLSLSDQVFLFPIYPASEPEIPGITAERLAQEVQHKSKKPVIFFASLEEAKAQIESLLQPSDLLLLQGAGDLPGQMQKVLIKRDNRNTVKQMYYR